MNQFIQTALVFITVLLSATGQEQIYAKVGERVTLPGSESSNYIYWYYNDKNNQIAWINPFGGRSSKNGNFSLSGSSLVIDDIHQFGTFYCDETTATGYLISSKTYKVNQLSVSKPDSPLLPGEPLSLDCNVASERPRIYWLSPQGEMRTTKTLTIGVTSKDSGQWTCVVNNEHRFPVSVQVIGLSLAPGRQYTSVNSALTVPCSLPPYISWTQLKEKGIKEVQWHFVPSSSGTQQTLFSLSLGDPIIWNPPNNRGLQPAADPAKGNLSLTKRQWKEADRGSYTCSMKFKNDVTLSTTVQVQVLQISSSPGPELIVGQRVDLTCSTADLLPANTQIKWIPPEKSSLQRSDDHRTNLTIPQVGTGDEGRWRCELWQNNTLLTSATITLKIEPILSVWMLVIICGAAVIVILLLVLAFILCRRRQRKTRHLRHKLCRCKNPKPKGFYRT